MTKLRAPLSFEDAINRIAGHLGWPSAAAEIGLEESALRRFSNPDDERCIKLQDAFLLDVAYRREGGEGAPILEAFALQLEASNRMLAATGDEIARRAAVAAKEGGEAIAALFAASRPGASRTEMAIAVREVREGIDALTATLPVLEHPGGG